MKPKSGYMYWWRIRGGLAWHFGYCTHESDGLVRMGSYNGDTRGGRVFCPLDIEWRDYK